MRITNGNGTAVSLAGFHLQSDPAGSEDFQLGSIVAQIGAGQTLEFQSGPAATTDAGNGIYSLTPAELYRDGDATDFARLLRPDITADLVYCHAASETATPTPTPTAMPTATPEPTPTPMPGETDAPTPTPISTPEPTPTPTPSPVRGDADCDGQVTSMDGLDLLRAAAGIEGAAPCAPNGVDCDGDIDALDALFVLRFVVGLAVSLPDGCPALGG